MKASARNKLKKIFYFEFVFSLFQRESFLMFTDGFPVGFPDFPSDRRSLIALEIYTTERSYVRGLEIIVLVRSHFVF